MTASPVQLPLSSAGPLQAQMSAPLQSSVKGSGQQHTPDEEPGDDEGPGVFMACVHNSGNIGIACYDASNAEVPCQPGPSCSHASLHSSVPGT